jgi:hypothetical protein
MNHKEYKGCVEWETVTGWPGANSSKANSVEKKSTEAMDQEQ